MRAGVISVILLLSAVVSAAETGPAGPAIPSVHLSLGDERDAMLAVVEAQLAAFRTEDWAKAYALAAVSFKSVVSAETFGAFITRNYAVIGRNTRADFGIPSDNGRFAIVPVRVFNGSDSEAYTWLLVKEHGVWRVTGVVPQRARRGA